MEVEALKRKRKLERSQWLLEIQNKQSEKQDLFIEKELYATLERRSEQERRLTQQLLAVRSEKERIKQNRLLRNEQYAQQRNLDYQNFIKRDQEAADKLRHEHEEHRLLLSKQYHDVQLRKQQMKFETHRLMCREMILELVSLSLKICELQEISGEVGSELLREWKTLFLGGKKIDDYEQQPLDDKPEENAVFACDPSVQLADDAEFKDYLEGQGRWTFESKPVPNPKLWSIVDNLLSINSTKDMRMFKEPLPLLNLKIAVLGKEFSGKTELSKLITSLFDCLILNVENFLTSDVLGEKANAVLNQGGEVDDEMLTSIVAKKIRESNNFILCGFPRTKQQATLIERELAGYEEPKVVKPGNLKKSDKKPQKQKSLIASDPNQTETIEGIASSCFDIVFLIEMDTETAFLRGTGRRIDPVDNHVYHLDKGHFPGEGVNERLKNISDMDLGQIHQRMIVFDEEQPKLIEWYQRFNNLHKVDENFNIYETITRVMESKVKPKEVVKVEVVEEKIEEKVSKIPPEKVAEIVKQRLDQFKKLTKRSPSQQLMAVLADEWAMLEITYTNLTKYLFRGLRNQRMVLDRYFYDTKKHFVMFLEQPDSKQEIVRAFQDEFNQLADDLRPDVEVKAELHQRVEDLREKLWAVCDERKEKSDLEKYAIFQTHFVEDHICLLEDLVLSMMQTEVDRYLGTRYIIQEYAKEMLGASPDEPTPLKTYQVQKPPIPTRDEQKGSVSNMRKKTKESKKRSTNVLFTSKPQDDLNDAFVAELSKANDLCTSFLNSIEEEEKKIQKTRPKDDNSELRDEFSVCLKTEDAIMRCKLDRILRFGLNTQHRIKQLSFDLGNFLEEKLGAHYKLELNAVKELCLQIKNSIELELKLPNELYLEGPCFEVIREFMVFEPEPPPRPETPRELEHFDKFTIDQLSALSRQFLKLSRDGMIACKNFIGLLKRVSNLPNSLDFVPISYSGQKFTDSFATDLLSILDPHETGYICWKKFIVFAGNVLPTEFETIDQKTQNLFKELMEERTLHLLFCCDYSAKKGFERAFGEKCTIRDILSLFSFTIVGDLYPRETLEEVFQDEEITFEEYIKRNGPVPLIFKYEDIHEKMQN